MTQQPRSEDPGAPARPDERSTAEGSAITSAETTPAETAVPEASADPAAPAPPAPQGRVGRVLDSDLVDHDLSDHDESWFGRTGRTRWRHPLAIGVILLVVGSVMTGTAGAHLGSMSAGTIGNAILLPDNTPVNIRMNAGEQRMFYVERGAGDDKMQCTVTDGRDASVPVQQTDAVILQGSDVLWHGRTMFTAATSGDHTLKCSTPESNRQVRAGQTVGVVDVVLTLMATGIGGIMMVAGVGTVLWVRRRSIRSRLTRKSS